MKKTAFSLAIGALALAASTAYGAAFMLTEQSAVMLGRAYAGAGVAGDDASAPFYNPAGMTLLPGTQVQFTGVGVSMHQNLKLKNGWETDCRNKTEFLPSFYITHQINPEWWVGLSVASPFGLSTNCGDFSPHPYPLSSTGFGHRGTEAKLTDFDINPSIAWKPTERFSVAAGISLQYAKAKLGMDLPNVALLQNDPAIIRLALASGTPASFHALEDGSSWAWGWNIGFMCKPIDTFRFGISYRSAIKHKATGYLNLTDNGIALPSKVTIKTPDTVYASAAWDATPNLNITGTIRWAKWKNVNEWHLVQGTAQSVMSGVNGILLSNVSINHHYKNTWLYALGADYKINSDWTIRGGVGYEKNALSDECCRTAVIPDGDRLFLSMGATYNMTKNWTLDFALLRVEGLGTSRFFDNDESNAALMKKLGIGNGETKQVGEWNKQNSWIYGMNLHYKF